MWLHAILSWRSCSQRGRRGTGSIQGLLTAPQALIEETRTLKWAASVFVWTIKFISRRALSPFYFFVVLRFAPTGFVRKFDVHARLYN